MSEYRHCFIPPILWAKLLAVLLHAQLVGSSAPSTSISIFGRYRLMHTIARIYETEDITRYAYHAMLSTGGGRLEPLQRRLVTLAIREGVVFGVGT